jgi:hypothetical protein
VLRRLGPVFFFLFFFFLFFFFLFFVGSSVFFFRDARLLRGRAAAGPARRVLLSAQQILLASHPRRGHRRLVAKGLFAQNSNDDVCCSDSGVVQSSVMGLRANTPVQATGMVDASAFVDSSDEE